MKTGNLKINESLHWKLWYKSRVPKGVIFLYQLSNEELQAFVRWVKDARYKYFQKNKYIFMEETIEDKNVYSDDDVEGDIIRQIDKIMDLSNDLKYIFECNEKVLKALSCLSSVENEIIKLHIIHKLTDKQVAKILGSTENAIRVKRNRIYKKINNGGKGNV